jgi:benzoate 4-monooxygenase
LIKGKDENDLPVGKEGLTAEALTRLIAGESRFYVIGAELIPLPHKGSDRMSNSSCAILYYLSSNPRTMLNLVESLASIARGKPPDNLLFEYGEVKEFTYLQACIDEALRFHSTSALNYRGSFLRVGRWFVTSSFRTERR